MIFSFIKINGFSYRKNITTNKKTLRTRKLNKNISLVNRTLLLRQTVERPEF